METVLRKEYYKPGRNKAPWKECGGVDRRTAKIMDYLLEKDRNLLASLCEALVNRNDTAQEYFNRAVDLYKKYDQGSHSFTKTALRHVGWDHPESVWDAIYAVVKGGYHGSRT